MSREEFVQTPSTAIKPLIYNLGGNKIFSRIPGAIPEFAAPKGTRERFSFERARESRLNSLFADTAVLFQKRC